MNDPQPWILMKIYESSTNPHYYLKPLWPIKQYTLCPILQVVQSNHYKYACRKNNVQILHLHGLVIFDTKMSLNILTCITRLAALKQQLKLLLEKKTRFLMILKKRVEESYQIWKHLSFCWAYTRILTSSRFPSCNILGA